MPTKSLRRNPGWKLEPETIDIVAAARGVLGMTNAEVIHLWAMQWRDQQGAARAIAEGGPLVVSAVAAVGAVAHMQGNPASAGVPGKQVADPKPMAVRVETPYQVQRRETLERLRAQLEGGVVPPVNVQEVEKKESGGETLVFPFDVVVGGEMHRVREFHGRRVLERIGPKMNVMLKNLTPQETVIYWHQRKR